MTVPQRNYDDAELVQRMAQGDKAALARLYDAHAGLLLGLAIRMLGGRRDAEDLVHDVFLEAWKRAADYDPARGTVKAWLCLRTRSRALDRKKSPWMARTVAWDDDLAHAMEGPALEPGVRLERERVRAALSTLSAAQRDVVDLFYFHGCSVAQVADSLRCTPGSVKSRLSAARSRLRSALSMPVVVP
jgi:RNA polymerase sigma-70 factor (ECF subfamily)